MLLREHPPRHERLRVFLASEDDANCWFAEHDPESVAFEYPVVTVQDRHS
jgi:hypothetical protein